MSKDRYDFLPDDTWEKVCELLNEDIRLDPAFGISCDTPLYPQAGQEMDISVCVLGMSGNEMMEWVRGDDCLKLSQAIIFDNDSCPDAIARARDSLKNTIAVLDAYLAEHAKPELVS
jgi:hypothetical protein